MNYIFLFDIDGTLIWSGGAGVRALDLAFQEVLGISDGMQGIVCDGKTDPAIVREVLTERKLASRENIQRLIDRYVGYPPAEVAAAENYQVLPGVRQTLELLQARPDVVIGLATGNVEAGARAKLERADLYRYFPVGGFGSDSEDRAELVRIGIRRARELLGDPRAKALVIGDTPRDVKAAQAASAESVAVATGHLDQGELAAAGADLVLADLSDPQAWIERFAG